MAPTPEGRFLPSSAILHSSVLESDSPYLPYRIFCKSSTKSPEVFLFPPPFPPIGVLVFRRFLLPRLSPFAVANQRFALLFTDTYPGFFPPSFFQLSFSSSQVSLTSYSLDVFKSPPSFSCLLISSDIPIPSPSFILDLPLYEWRHWPTFCFGVRVSVSSVTLFLPFSLSPHLRIYFLAPPHKTCVLMCSRK